MDFDKSFLKKVRLLNIDIKSLNSRIDETELMDQELKESCYVNQISK